MLALRQERQRCKQRILSASVAAASALLLARAGTLSLGFSSCSAPHPRHTAWQLERSLSAAPNQAVSAKEASLPTVSLLVAGAAALSLVAGTRRAGGIGRAAAEKEDMSVEFLNKKYAGEVEEIRKLCKDLPENYDDMTLLRYAMQHTGNPGAAVENIKEVVQWRSGEGSKIVTAAKEAIAKATAGGGWDNTPVLAAAPHSSKISKFITPAQMVVVSTKAGDLVTCIRASTIDSEKLMSEVTEEEMVEFFLYAREVNATIADMRSRATGHLCRLIAANDLTGVSKFPDQKFQNALTGSSKRAVTLYPGLAGPTILLNLPWLARMLVSVLTPLFPGAVREKLKFARTPMDYMTNLQDITKEPTRSTFVDDLQAVMND
eukprot:TRINITY_DN95233_c0_g1_i1.p1 TRINITY_DN95233_c0_g1~~TRINITY_DN95233_c0_g1_i1.p1  ORF type:complete len:376 (+),score=87.03 TRINITY_DN95233_c0_g1_i1:74-1201(+)